MRKPITYANVTATLALVLAMTSGAVAANHYLVNSTKQISPKVLKKLKGNSGATGKEGRAGKDGAPGKEGASGKEGAPGKEGKQGKEGEAGEEGKEGAAATTLWARVKYDGTLKRGSGAVSSEKVAEKGGYEVVFNQNVSACAYEATVGSATVSPNNTQFDEKNFGEVITEPRFEKTNAVYVETYGTKGEGAEESFHLAVFC